MCCASPSWLALAWLPARLQAAAEPEAAGPPALARWQGDLAVLLGMALPGGPVPDPAARPARIWPHSDAEDGLWGWQQRGLLCTG